MTSELDHVLRHEDPQFAQAVLAVIKADPKELIPLLQRHPSLAVARSHSDHRSTLLHYIASNGIEDELQLSSQSIYQQVASADIPLDVAAERIIRSIKVLIDSGAEVDALAETYGGGNHQTTLSLFVSSTHPMKAGLAGRIAEALCAADAKVDGIDGDSAPLVTALAFGNHQAVSALAKAGATVDNLLLAAATGDLTSLQHYLQPEQIDTGNLERSHVSWANTPNDPTQVAELALVYAAFAISLIAFGIALSVESTLMRCPPDRMQPQHRCTQLLTQGISRLLTT